MKDKFIIGITAIATIACFRAKSSGKNLENAEAAWQVFYNAHRPLKVQNFKNKSVLSVLLDMVESWDKTKLTKDIKCEKENLAKYKNALTPWYNNTGLKLSLEYLESLADAYIKAAEIYLEK